MTINIAHSEPLHTIKYRTRHQTHPKEKPLTSLCHQVSVDALPHTLHHAWPADHTQHRLIQHQQLILHSQVVQEEQEAQSRDSTVHNRTAQQLTGNIQEHTTDTNTAQYDTNN